MRFEPIIDQLLFCYSQCELKKNVFNLNKLEVPKCIVLNLRVTHHFVFVLYRLYIRPHNLQI